jgi:hypothetical protein
LSVVLDPAISSVSVFNLFSFLNFYTSVSHFPLSLWSR